MDTAPTRGEGPSGYSVVPVVSGSVILWTGFVTAAFVAILAAHLPRALAFRFAYSVHPLDDPLAGVSFAALVVTILWLLDWTRVRGLVTALYVIDFYAVTLCAFFASNWSGCLNFCRPHLGVFGLSMLVGLSASILVGLIRRRSWAWIATTPSPIAFFLAMADAWPVRGDAVPVVVVILLIMFVIWALVGGVLYSLARHAPRRITT